MPRGGRRQGAGRKPKTPKEHLLSGNAGKRNLSLVPMSRDEVAALDEPLPATDVEGEVEVDVVTGIAIPSALLTQEGEQAYWRMYAPLALEAGTLTAKSIGGFILLCQVAARADLIWEDISREGFTESTEHGTKAHPLLPAYRGFIQRQESLLQRYLLAAMAKADSGAGKPVKEDDDVAALRSLMAIK